MKRRLLFLLALSLFIFFNPKNTYAFDSSTYRDKSLCGNYEVAGVHSDGSIVTVGCHSTYENAKNEMKSNGAEDLVIFTKVSGSTKIIDANVALLDLSVNPETLTYFYTNKELTGSAYTYMDTGSLYGGVDGAHIESDYSNTNRTWVAKVRVGNFTGWIKASTYEIVPITWIKSTSTYTVSASEIRHNYVAKIQNNYNGSGGRTIGPKPEMLGVGTYYSYDGHYFYTNLKTLIKDYKNGNYNNSVNKNNPYYNYYMYLSNHTKTTYSSMNIDEYIRNNMGYKENVYGNAASQGTSRLYGMGTFFYYAQEKYGVNAILSLSLSRNETGNGTSNLAINKNNGFGLNAVDSNPTQAANWYATFSSSILGYASKWITYGYAHPRDWRYFGPQFGDKWIGMNVKYASDTYWSEKMAANYYALDRALGLQDYNYYQLGVVNGPTRAYQNPSTSSRFIYEYPEKEDALVIVDETTVNGEKWYKVVSDLNIDTNYNEISNGDYNWNGYVYVKANEVRKINQAKNGYVSPLNVYKYKDTNYTYDLYIENANLKPKVAITTKSTPYYYDSSLNSKTGKTLLQDRYVMVYTAAYENNIPVAYLVTSDYFHDQKHWISADSIKFTNNTYGKVSVTVSGNQYTWVNYNTDDAKYSLISGLYTNTYVPVLDSVSAGGNTWYKVPVNLTGNDNVYGYTLSSAPGVSITTDKAIVVNQKPVITANDKEIDENTEFNPKENVTAYDPEDGNITNKIEVIENNVNIKQPGEYNVTYKVTDSSGENTTKTITVRIKENKAPVIEASDIELTIGDIFNEKENVKATDPEDGDRTRNIKVIENTVDTTKVGEYKVIYEVSDSKGKTTKKEIKVVVKEKEIIPEEKQEEVETKEKTKDSKEIDIDDIDIDELLEHQTDGEFNLENITWNKANMVFNISGYLIILNKNNINKEYALILVNKDTEEVYVQKIDGWNKNTPYDLGEEDGNSYSDSWFKGNIDLSDVSNGDYDLYMLATTDDYFTIEKVNNISNQDIDRRGEDSKHGYNFKVQQKSKTKEINLSVRDELYTINEAPTSRNMVNGYEEVDFKNNKLYLYGYSYDYEGVYSNQLSVSRKLILENTKTYKTEIFDLGSTKGPFAIETFDKKDKTYAWYEKSIDISKLEKGIYTLSVYTKTSNAENYDELADKFRMINSTTTVNNKKYIIKYNKDRNNRIELIVE